MKILKAKTSHPKKKILKISDISYIKYYEENEVYLQDLSKKFNMINAIEVEQRHISKTPRMGALGIPYIEKRYTVLKGNQRITLAKKLGYTHIEGIIVND